MSDYTPTNAPAQVTELMLAGMTGKSKLPVVKMFLLGILAGAFIAFGAEASSLAAHNVTQVGIQRLIMGCVFPVGLIMVVLLGTELFTGNCLMVTGLFDKRFGIGPILRNWLIVYIGNFVGALLIAWLVNYTGLLGNGEGLLGAITIKTAIGKCGLDFGKAFMLGILCNWMVCLAIWMATGAQVAIGKMLAIWFCIGLFIVGGFEHSVANMYFIPSGLMASGNQEWVNMLGLDTSGLTWGNFLIKNLLPVTLGNIVGGGFFVGTMYWVTNRK